MGRFDSLQQAPMAGFNLGQASAVRNPLGIAVEQLLNRVNAMQDVQMQARAKAQAEFGAYQSFLGQGTGQGTAPGGFQVSKIQAGPFTLESPEMSAKQVGAEAQARETAQRTAKITSYSKSLEGTLQRISQLARQIPAPTAGGGRFFQEIGTRYKGFTQELPQVAQVEQERKAIAGQIVQVIGGENSSRLSDQDVQRVLGLLQSPAGDTIPKRALSTVELVDAINAIPEVASSGGVRLESILTEPEIALGRRLQGRSLFQTQQGQ